MLKISRSLPLLIIVLSALTTACGGGSSSSPASNTPQEAGTHGLLKSAGSDDELATAIRAGMKQNSMVAAPPSIDFSPAPETPDSGPALGNFSTTNLQEAGVDEGDRVKYDGEILYVADYPQGNAFQPPLAFDSSGVEQQAALDKPVISMYRTDPATATLEAIGHIEHTEGDANTNLYLRVSDQNKQLISISENYGVSNWGLFADFSYWQSQNTQVKAWTVDDPQAPVSQFSLDIEGALLVSRRVGDILYVITRFSPVVDGVLNYPENEAEESGNEALLAAVEATDLLPTMSRNGQPGQSLVSGSDCYIPNSEYAGPETLLPSGSILTVTAIDLSAPENIHSLCLNGYSSGYYVSTQSLYLTTNAANDKTLIHKIALNDGLPEYRGSGEVVGYLGTSNPSFMMSEIGDDLRVMSSVWDDRFFPMPVMQVDASNGSEQQQETEELFGRHQLTILRENTTDARLERIARLPNAERPAHIGKPGEDVYAARFLGDRAYVVTFETIDPLYVIDLSNPTDPKIEGALEIPGFSTYLHPLSDNLLLGIGSEVSPNTALVQGVKIALFDVGNASNPVELDSKVIGKRGSSSPAMYDHRALTLLQTDSDYRLALPIQRHDVLPQDSDPENPWAFYDWSETALFEFSVDPIGGSITQVGKLVSEAPTEQQPYPTNNFFQSRSVIHDDAVYFVQSKPESVLSGQWGN